MKKCAVMFFLLVLSMQTASYHRYVSGMELVSASSDYLESSEIQILSEDEIIYKYRILNGTLQYRRWNNTKMCWVDPNWINV